MNRRDFFRNTGALLAGGIGGALISTTPAKANTGEAKLPLDSFGVLVDTTHCIGCRQCELACDRVNNLTDPPALEKGFDDDGVFNKRRKYSPEHLTVVNRYPNQSKNGDPIYIKKQCMHCNHAPCVSACIVGALQKESNGAVSYDYTKCIGCRYCMVACPFQVPANEFDNALTPHIRKCSLCFERISKNNGIPACVDICPQGALIFGNRKKILKIAHSRINNMPDRYMDHIFGENDSGGTSWMYLAGVPFEHLGFPKLGNTSPAQLSETIMHGMFKHWIPPVAIYCIIGVAMWMYKPRENHVENVQKGVKSK